MPGPVVRVVHEPADTRAAAEIAGGIRRICPRRIRPVVRSDTYPSDLEVPTVALLSSWRGRTAAQQNALERQRFAAPPLLALLDGTLTRPPGESDALPPGWLGMFQQEPRWVDLRWAPLRETGRWALSAILPRHRRDPRWTEAMADLAAPLVGISKQELVRAEARRLRQVRLAITTLIVAVVVASMLTAGLSLEARRQRRTAIGQRDSALAAVAAHRAGQQFVVNPQLSFLLARQVLRDQPDQLLARTVVRQAPAALASATVLAWPGETGASDVWSDASGSFALLALHDGTLRRVSTSADASTSPLPPLIADAQLRAPALVSVGGVSVVAVSRATGRVVVVEPDASQAKPAAWSLPSDTTALARATVRGPQRGQVLVRGTASGVLEGRDVIDGRLLWSTDLHAGGVTALAVSGDGRMGAAATLDGRLHLLAIDGLTVRSRAVSRIRALDEPAGSVLRATALAFVAHDTQLAVGSNDGRVRFVTVPELAPRSSVVTTETQPGSVTGITEVQTLVVATGSFEAMAVYDPASARQINQWSTFGGGGVVEALPGRLLVATASGLTYLRPMTSVGVGLQPGRELADHLVLQPNPTSSRVLAIASVSGRLSLTSRSLPGLTRSTAELPIPDVQPLVLAAADHDPRLVFVIRRPGLLTTWNSDTGQISEVALPVGPRLTSLSRAVDSDLLVGGSDGKLLTWRISGGRAVPGQAIAARVAQRRPVWLDGHTAAYVSADHSAVLRVDFAAGTATTLAAMPNLTQLTGAGAGVLIAGSGDGRLARIDAGSGSMVWLPRMAGAVTALTVLDSGELVVGLGNGSVMVTAVDGGGYAAQLGLHDHAVMGIVPLGNGTVATSDSSGDVRLWSFDLDSMIREGCRIMHRAFTESEAHDFGVVAGEDPCRP